MYQILTPKQFDKEVKKCIKRGYDISLLEKSTEILEETEKPRPFHTNLINGQATIRVVGNAILSPMGC